MKKTLKKLFKTLAVGILVLAALVSCVSCGVTDENGGTDEPKATESNEKEEEKKMKVFVNFVKTIEVDIPDNLADVVEAHRELGFGGLADESRDQLVNALEKGFDNAPKIEKVLSINNLAGYMISNSTLPTFTDFNEVLTR